MQASESRSTQSAAASAEEVVRRLGLQPHPEGGFFRETWRHAAGDGGRGAGTAILFLLRAGEVSRWHRVDATEIWHAYAGAPSTLRIVTAEGERHAFRLGPDLLAGEQPQVIVPAGAWQQTEADEGWALYGCTVSPAFEFAGFEMAPPGWGP
ncbi:MAG: cupin domain-containing protein [Deltaproteobacteria bacterium]|nr:cupin domain-containing protein [Deltaproteobacteria bacterium]